MNVDVRIENIDKIKSGLNSSPLVFAKHVNKAIKQSIMAVERNTKPKTPVDTGYLRLAQVPYFYPLVGIYEPVAEYAIFVHEGTKFMKARPFLQQGLDDSRQYIRLAFEKALNDSLQEIAR